jgi:putative ABC transport system substrate-binding protein
MRRREFISLLGGTAVAWPFVVRAQQGERVKRVGALQSLSENGPFVQRGKAVFVSGMRQLGWKEDADVVIDYRWGGGDSERIRQLALELVRAQPDVIWAVG